MQNDFSDTQVETLRQLLLDNNEVQFERMKDYVDAKFTQQDARLDTRFDKIEERLDVVEAKLDTVIETVSENHERRIAKLEQAAA